MIDLWYLNTKNNSPEHLNCLIQFLPQEMIKEILRFKYHVDRRLKLFGKLMVKKYYKDEGLEFNWNEWCIASNGKPYCKMRKKFSISHSGEYVIVTFSDGEIGVDIEGLAEFDIASISTYFHPEEIEHIKNTSDSKDAFFRLWTRKEAYLKAVGKGIVDGLNNESCLPDQIVDKEIWYLYSLPIIPDYKVALCTQIADCRINIRELSLVEFRN